MKEQMLKVLQSRWDRVVWLVKECHYDLHDVIEAVGFDVTRRFVEEVTGTRVIIDENDNVRYN